MGDGIEEVIALARSGNRPAARQLVLELLKQNPDDVVALLWLAYTSDNVDEVDVVLNRILTLDPGNEKALEWQGLVKQKQARMRAGQTGALAPLPPTPPATFPGQAEISQAYVQSPSSTVFSNPTPTPTPVTPNAPLYVPPPSQPYTNLTPATPTASQTVQPYQPNSQPLANWTAHTGQYQVTVSPGPKSNPAMPYVQPIPVAPAVEVRRKIWPFIVGGIVLLVALGVGLFLILAPNRGKPGLADYRLFTNITELVNEGFVDERVAIETRFMGGYTKDSTGTYLLTAAEGKNVLYIQWHESVSSINDFRPGQYITVYGRLSGISGGKVTLKVDKVLLSDS
jgi:hypothetical protein